MIEYINKRMIEWSTWCKRREDGGMGYPSKSNYCSLVQIHGAGGAGPITEAAAALEIEGIIIKIRQRGAQRSTRWRSGSTLPAISPSSASRRN